MDWLLDGKPGFVFAMRPRTQRLCDVLPGHLLQNFMLVRQCVHRLKAGIPEEELLYV